MTKPEPAVLVWAGIIAAALTADVLLVAHGHRSLSQVADCRLGRAMRRYLNGHLDSVLVLDVFALAAHGIARTRKDPTHVQQLGHARRQASLGVRCLRP